MKSTKMVVATYKRTLQGSDSDIDHNQDHRNLSADPNKSADKYMRELDLIFL